MEQALRNTKCKRLKVQRFLFQLPLQNHFGLSYLKIAAIMWTAMCRTLFLCSLYPQGKHLLLKKAQVCSLKQLIVLLTERGSVKAVWLFHSSVL